MQSSQPFRLVIVGGGVAGLEVATRLGRRLGRGPDAVPASVTLVDRGLSHLWKPMLHTVAAGTAHPDREKVGFLLQASRNNFRFHPGSLETVDRDRRVLHLGGFDDSTGTPAPPAVRELPYDALLLSIGSRANDFGTPGVVEHAVFLDSLPEAESFFIRFRRAVVEAIEARRPLDLAIVGGGATGVELAAEIKHALDAASRFDPGLPERSERSELRLSLIESGPRLLSAFPDHVSEAATRTLRSLGVRVLTGTAVIRVDADGLDTKDGQRFDTAFTVWAAGVRAPDAVQNIDGLERSRSGQLVIRPTLQTTRDELIFALGDCASLPQPGNKPVPATAQAARQQAMHLSRHFRDWIRTRAMPPFNYRDRGALVSLADYNGWGTMGRYTFGGGALKGLSARVAHDLLYRQHQIELQGLGRGALGWLSNTLARAVDAPVRLD